MKIEALKEKARRHEQNEEWRQALDLYLKAIGDLADEEEGQPDIGLYNRAGDIQTRIGEVEAAVEHYERAVDLYLEADLPNNAIAFCKKVLRNLPDRASMFLRMGQIRADQGFLVDARQNFLKYAELEQQAGEMDEAFRALIEFADLAPDDLEIRMAVAQQLESSERIEEAVEQYIRAHQQLTLKGRTDEAAGVAEKIEELAPGTDIPEPEAAVAGPGRRTTDLPGFETTSYHLEDEEAEEEAEEEESEEIEVEFGEIELGGDEEEDEEEPEEEVAVEAAELGDFEIAGAGDEEEEEEEEAEELPMMDLGEDEEEEAEELPMMDFGEDEEEEAEELPMMDFGEDGEEDVEELPMMEFDEEPGEEEEEGEGEGEEAALTAEAFGESGHRDTPEEFVEPAEEMPELEVELDDTLGPADEAGEAMEEAAEEVGFTAEAEAEEDDRALAEAGDFEGALRAVRGKLRSEPDDLDHHQRRVEYAHRSGDRDQLVPAYLDLAGVLDRQGADQKARAVLQQVLEIDPGNQEARARLERAASESSYVDLGSLVLDEEKPTGETRWVVPAQEPTGDEEADFASMLSQFKQKVSEHVAQDDLTAHYDLGTAYKEMGLVDEAIAEFQQALRTDAEHLPTYEMLGQCFMEQGEYEVAIRSLSKAVSVPTAVEDDLIGIYYYLARAHQEAGNSDQAREFYEKVFSLDINFRDVTERLRALR